jgi:response regulator RpfG family c-di-GMP phosphodiesterase/tRNA A-37 threonylcarbamoyl transferase component Bud32
MGSLSEIGAGPFWTPDLDAASMNLPEPASAFLTEALELQLLSPAQVERFLTAAGPHLNDYATAELLGSALVQAGLLTIYQVDRMLAGTTHGLVLGNYRVLERLGAGSMGIVFLAEHALMKRRVALKVLPVDEDCPQAIMERFYSEMRVLADLRHPNIVAALDAGQVPGAGPRMPNLLYLVLELVPGGDLEQWVLERGVVDVAQACTWVRQAAEALQLAHDHHLIHRDIKPSNLLLTEQRQVKVVDFGLVRQFTSRLTDSRSLLGTLEYMAPEQGTDPSAVDGRADIYGLGATLFWLLTGEQPYPSAPSVSEALRALQNTMPRRVRSLNPSVPVELEMLIARMLDKDPGQRPALPITVSNALLPYCAFKLERLDRSSPNSEKVPDVRVRNGKNALIVEDEHIVRRLFRKVLEPHDIHCDEAADGQSALAALARMRYDLVLLDLNLPDMDGLQICRLLRERPENSNCKIIIVSGRGNHETLARSLPEGADDFIPKPVGVAELEMRVGHALRLKQAQDEADSLAQQLAVTNRQMEDSLLARTGDVRRAQDALLFTMQKMSESRDGETEGHSQRLQRYCGILAETVGSSPKWEGVVNGAFLEQLARCVPLHDIGKIGVPESLLLKPGMLNGDERLLIQTHTVIGDQLLESLGREHGESLGFLGMASAIVRHHHEHFDGRGYPDRLSGDAIPPAARLVALADVYDALRRQRFHKPALTHDDATRIILEESAGQFDPAVLEAFASRQFEFERIYRSIRT